MKRKILLLSVVGVTSLNTFGQVQDVSFIITPNIGYNWFDPKSTVENGTTYGVQAGFGFGRIIELTGSYEQSANLQQQFGSYQSDIDKVIPGFKFQNRDVKVTRVGGQIKANIPLKDVAPYITIGTGVQTFERDFDNNTTYKNETLYGMGGIGVKISLGSRATLNFEGRGIINNMNPSSLLYNPNATSDFDNWINSRNRTQMYNWAANASLQFYLGGTRYRKMSALDRAYYNEFSGGISQTKFTIAPIGAYMSFNDNAAYKNAFFLGGEVGVDFTDFVGIKAYYMQSIDRNSKEFAFDYMGMFGLDFIGKLNVSRGIVPYVTVGGGYLFVTDDYRGKNRGTDQVPMYQSASSGYYAKGGLGIEIPVATHVDLYGSANLVYTLNNNKTPVSELVSTDQLYGNTLYTVGIKVKIAKKADPTAARNAAFNQEFAGERAQYQQKIKTLEKDLVTAYQTNDTARIREIMEEKNQADRTKDSLATVLKMNQLALANATVPATVSSATPKVDDGLIRLSPQELETLIDKVVNGVENENTPNLENRLDRLEELLINMSNNGGVSTMNSGTSRTAPAAAPAAPSYDYQSINDRLINEINNLKQQVDEQNNQINNLKNKQSSVAPAPVQTQVAPVQTQVISTPTTTISTTGETKGSVEGAIINHGASAFIGVNFGDATTFNLGVRGNWGFTSTPIIFMPEVYVGLGKKNAFGISANAIYPFKIKDSKFSPYAGLGLGLNFVGSYTTFNPNFIVGTTYPMGKGSLFADYTARGAFRNNQIALGYRFKF